MTWKMDPAAYEALRNWADSGMSVQSLARRASELDRGEDGPPGKLARLARTFGRRCHYCHTELSRAEMTRDHVIPVSRGGTNALANLVISCGACNLEKANRTPVEWRGSTCCDFHATWVRLAG